MRLQTLSVLLSVLISYVYCKDCLTQSCLTNLYNSHVTYAELYTRPLSGSSSGSSGSSGRKRFFIGRLFPGLYHAGVVVTVTNGDRWLIHKGSDYGDTPNSPSTVITDANYMSGAWTLRETGNVHGHTVNDFMIAARITDEYHLYGPNCQTAANGMWNLVD